jgi:hypothetical protein
MALNRGNPQLNDCVSAREGAYFQALCQPDLKTMELIHPKP